MSSRSSATRSVMSRKSLAPGPTYRSKLLNLRRKNIYSKGRARRAPYTAVIAAGLSSKTKYSKGYNNRKKYHSGGTPSFNKKVREVVMGELSADNTYLINYVDQARGVAGNNNQAVQGMWAISQIADSTLSAGAYDNLLLDDPQVLSTILANISNNKTAEFTRKSYEVECTIVNAETSPCEIWEYRCKARRAQIGTADTAIQAGFADAVAGIGTKATYQTLGATPFMNPRFTSQYKVMKVKKKILKPSQKWCIKYAYRKPRKYTAEQLEEGNAVGTSYYNMLKGQQFSLFVCHGTWATNAQATGSANQLIGISNYNIGLAYKIRVHYSWLADTTIAQGVSGYTTGFSANQAGAPAPVVLNQPLSAITDFSVAGGLGVISNQTAGLRVYTTLANNSTTVLDNPEAEQ